MWISSLARLFGSVVFPSAIFIITFPGAGVSGAATGAVVSWFLTTLGLFPEAMSFLTTATASPAVIFMVTTFTAFTAVNFTVRPFMIFMVQGRGLTIGTSAALLRRTWRQAVVPARSADSTMAAGRTTFPAVANRVSAAAFMV